MGMFVKLGDEDYVDPDEVEFFYINRRQDSKTQTVVFMKSGQKTYIDRHIDDVARVLNEAKDPLWGV